MRHVKLPKTAELDRLGEHEHMLCVEKQITLLRVIPTMKFQ